MQYQIQNDYEHHEIDYMIQGVMAEALKSIISTDLNRIK